jgi:hemerythrin
VKEGQIEIFYGNRLIETQGIGGFFGEENVLFESKNLFSAVTTKESVILHLSKDEIKNIPILEWKLLESYERRLRTMPLSSSPALSPSN